MGHGLVERGMVATQCLHRRRDLDWVHGHMALPVTRDTRPTHTRAAKFQMSQDPRRTLCWALFRECVDPQWVG